MTNNLTAKFDNYYVAPAEAQYRINSNLPAQPVVYYAIQQYIDTIIEIGKIAGMSLDPGEVFTNFLGYAQNSSQDVDSAAASLNSQLLPLVGVCLAMRRSFGIQLR